MYIYIYKNICICMYIYTYLYRFIHVYLCDARLRRMIHECIFILPYGMALVSRID